MSGMGMESLIVQRTAAAVVGIESKGVTFGGIEADAGIVSPHNQIMVLY